MITSFLILTVLSLFAFGIFYYRVYAYAWYVDFPKPIYQFEVIKDVMVPMQDGVKLATDIYRPKTSEKCPVIIIRTPYDKRGNVHHYKKMALLFASQGYVFSLFRMSAADTVLKANMNHFSMRALTAT